MLRGERADERSSPDLWAPFLKATESALAELARIGKIQQQATAFMRVPLEDRSAAMKTLSEKFDSLPDGVRFAVLDPKRSAEALQGLPPDVREAFRRISGMPGGPWDEVVPR